MSSSAVTCLGLATLGVLLAGYLAQQFLPPPVPKVVGIDLGTTYSCVGVYHAVSGDVQIFKNKQGHKCIPSVVTFTADGVVVGHQAAGMSAHSHPYDTLYDAKRFIGKPFSVAELATETVHYPFKLVANKSGSVSYVLSEANNFTKVMPHQVAANILATLKATAETNLSSTITHAVISVPAEFNAMQRYFTKLAAEMVGIQVLRIINEPTAAALAYGIHKKATAEIVVVVDLGGGTLDVSLLRVQGGMFHTQALAGNNHLGGQDFNERLLQFILSLIQHNHGKQITDVQDLQRLRVASEETKLRLSTQPSAIIDVKLSSLIANDTNTDGLFKHKILREDFERINADLLKKIIDPIREVLRETEMSPQDVDEIVLVGGSTRIPRVRRLIADFFGKEPNVAVDPELAVVTGVSIQAGILSGAWPLKVSATEIPHHLRKVHLQ